MYVSYTINQGAEYIFHYITALRAFSVPLLHVPLFREYTENKSLSFYSDDKKYSFKKVYIYLNNSSASCSEVLALSLKENLNNVELIGKSTKKKGVGQQIFTYERNIIFYIVNFKWRVHNKNVYDLNEYLKKYSDEKLDSDQDYFDIVKGLV